MTLSTTAVASAAAIAASAYLNARLCIGTDVKSIRHDRQFRERVGAKVQSLGDTCSIYAVFDAVDPNIEFLWFEGKTWAYGEIKKGRSDHRLGVGTLLTPHRRCQACSISGEGRNPK